MSETGPDPPADNPGESVPSRAVTGAERVGRALQRARGRMSQKAAARHWHVAYSTLCALEQGKDRNYQSHTLAQFDVMLGVDTWALYSQADVEPAISWNQIDDLRAELAELRAELEAIRVVPAPTGLEALQGELTAAERADLVSFAHWLIARRRPHNGS